MLLGWIDLVRQWMEGKVSNLKNMVVGHWTISLECLSQRVRHAPIHKWLNSPWFIASLFRQISRTESNVAFSFGTILCGLCGCTPVADPWFPRQGEPTYYLAKCFLKTAWKWKKLDPEWGCIPVAPLDLLMHTHLLHFCTSPSSIPYTTIEEFRVTLPVSFHVAPWVTHEWMDRGIQQRYHWVFP